MFAMFEGIRQYFEDVIDKVLPEPAVPVICTLIWAKMKPRVLFSNKMTSFEV